MENIALFPVMEYRNTRMVMYGYLFSNTNVSFYSISFLFQTFFLSANITKYYLKLYF
jgi:hypothetical protein